MTQAPAAAAWEGLPQPAIGREAPEVRKICIIWSNPTISVIHAPNAEPARRSRLSASSTCQQRQHRILNSRFSPFNPFICDSPGDLSDDNLLCSARSYRQGPPTLLQSTTLELFFRRARPEKAIVVIAAKPEQNSRCRAQREGSSSPTSRTTAALPVPAAPASVTTARMDRNKALQCGDGRVVRSSNSRSSMTSRR
jgi:hypothetical protein